ncbi:hypothetical protein DYB38_002462 [Aphanomyces astaci]|uniref:HECT-type E3 ubiquitin transferase n=1 Tax=Aphanomyces astaci TaxID=112090 RepID=A0A397CQ83_APHAT|nr:hypothetical protein DYB38_002462 [Aphanomyces astaci]
MICGAEAPRFPPSPGESKFIQSILSTWEGVRKRVNDTSSSGMEVTEPAVTVSSDAASVRATLDAFLNALQQTTDWPFEGQADLLNYGALLDAFHVVLGELTHTDGGANASLLLADEGKNTTAAPPSSSTQRFAWGVSDRERLAYQVLRVTAILLENSINKHKFPSLDHVTSLIASTSDRVSLEAVKVVAMLSLPPHSHRHPIDTQNQSDAMLTGSSTLKKRLLVVADALGNVAMADYLSEPSSSSPNDSLVYQYYRFDDQVQDSVLVSVAIPRFVGNGSVDAWSTATLAALVDQFSVPSKHHLKLLCRIRSSAWREHRHTREAAVVARLQASLALFSLFGDAHDVVQYLEEHPDLTAAVLDLVQATEDDKDDHPSIPLAVQVAALQVLTALVNDKRSRGVGVLSRQSAVLTTLGVGRGATPGAFVSLVRTCLGGLVLDDKATADSSPADDVDMDLAVAFVEATNNSQSTTALLRPFRDVASPRGRRLTWSEHVLGLLCPLVGLHAGASTMTECGVVPSLLHAISCRSVSPLHTSVLVQCIQALELTLTNHAPAAILFRELNGVTILVDRLSQEIVPSPSDSARVLVVALLNMLSVSFHTQGIMSAGTTPRFIREDATLNKLLHRILRHLDVYGTIVFSQAATLVADIINNDPTCVNHVHATGLADAFLESTCRWDLHAVTRASSPILPPCPELMMALPNVVSALCMTSTYIDKVAAFEPLAYLLDMFTLPTYVSDIDYLQGDVASIVATGLDELMRHVPSMARFCIEACTRALKKVVAATTCSHATLLRLTMHLCDVVEPVLAKVEHATRFADNGGVDALMHLYGRVLPPSSTYVSTSYNQMSPLPHYTASQSLTLAARAYASHQPAAMLAKLMAALVVELDQVDVMEVPPTDVRADYLRQLAQIEWLVSLVVWTIRTPHASGGSQSRRLMAEFTSPSSQRVLTRVLTLDRSVQLERMALERHSAHDEPSTSTTSSSSTSSRGEVGQIASLLTLKFSLMVRNLQRKFAHTICTQLSSSSDLHDQLDSIVQVLQLTLDSILATSDRYIRHGALVFLMETITALLFDGKRERGGGVVLLLPLALEFIDKKLLARVLEAFTSAVTTDLPDPTKQDVRLCQAGAALLHHLADVHAITSSKSKPALPDTDLIRLKAAFHILATDAVLPVWTHPRLPAAGKVVSAVVPVVATLLKQCLDKTTDGGTPTSAPPADLTLDASVVSSLEMMGFTLSHVELALRQIGANDVEMAMEWLLEHPEVEFVAQSVDPNHVASAGSLPSSPVPTYTALRATLASVPLAVVSASTDECVTRAVADLLVLQASQADEDRVRIVQSFDQYLNTTSSSCLESVAHVLALVVHGDCKSRAVLLTQASATVARLVQIVVNQSDSVDECVAPILLVLDALAVADDTAATLDPATKQQLVDSCARLMRLALPSGVGHAVWQVAVRLTRDLELVDRFVAVDGVDACINTPSVFDGYKELTSAILAHVLEYPEVLQARMEEKIVQSMKKLSLRLGGGSVSSAQRILPRNLLSDLGVVAMRDEKLFLSALKETVQVKKSSTGRVYVQLNDTDDTDIGSKKLTRLPIPHASKIMALLVRRVESLWATKDPATATYLYFLVHLVTMFRTSCGAVLLADHGPFLSQVMREMVPYPELNAKLRGDDDKEDEAKSRVHHAHRLLVHLCAHPDGCKKILLDVAALLEAWPTHDTTNKSYALTCLHGWCALLMSVLWPREDKDKMWEHTKALLGKKDVVAILMQALRRVDLSHPLARSTVTMVLRPLAALTRPWVAHRLKKKKQHDKATLTTAAAAADDPATTTTFHDEPSRLRVSSAEFEDIRMSNPEEEEEEDDEEEDGMSDSSGNDEEGDDEEGDEEGDDEEGDDEEEEEDPVDDDGEFWHAPNRGGATSQHPPLWESLDDGGLLQSEDSQESSHSRDSPRHPRSADAADDGDPRSMVDLFAFHRHPPGLHHPAPSASQWSHLFREFEQDGPPRGSSSTHHRLGRPHDDDYDEDDRVFDLRDQDEDDVFSIPLNVLERAHANGFRRTVSHLIYVFLNGICVVGGGAMRQRANTTATGPTNVSVAGLTHPLLAQEGRRGGGGGRGQARRPPSRHHHHHNPNNVYSMHASFRRSLLAEMGSHSSTVLPPSSWDNDPQSHVRQVVQRMEHELNDLWRPDDEEAAQPSADDESVAVQALTSTLGESSLDSPPPEVPNLPTQVAVDTTASNDEPQPLPPSPPSGEAATTAAPAATEANEPSAADGPVEGTGGPVPPAPVVDAAALFNFTLDLGTLPPPPPPQLVAPRAAEDTVDAEPTTTQLVCPDGMDPEVFHSLPPDMQAEVIAANPRPSTAAPSSPVVVVDGASFQSSYDQDTLDALPADIRDEILANERREWELATAPPPDISLAQDMDNASFVASLAPELREEILVTSDDAFLQTLPSSVRAEAMILRERAAFRAVQAHGRLSQADDQTAHFFQRPTLRRMLTSHGNDLGGGGGMSTRRYGRGAREDGRGLLVPAVEDESKRGLVHVDKEEFADAPPDHLASVTEASIQHLLTVLYMSQSILKHHRVFQTVVSNLCMYPTLRRWVRSNLVHVLAGTRPSAVDSTKFPPSAMIGCSGSQNDGEVLARGLTVLVALTKDNVRLRVDFLQSNGLSTLVALLGATRNGSHLDLLLEALEYVTSPLIRLAGPAADHKSPEVDTDPATEWIPVPTVVLSATELYHLVSVLALDQCTAPMQTRVLSILKLLSTTPETQQAVLDTLVESCDRVISASHTTNTAASVLQTPQQEVKLLRLLHTLSDLSATTEQFTDHVQKRLNLLPVWQALSASLAAARAVEGWGFDKEDADEADGGRLGTVIEGKSAGASCAMGALLTRFLPMIEAFFVVNARDAAHMTLAPPSGDDDLPVDVHATLLANFVEANRVLLNMLVREKPSLLDTSLAALIKIPQCRAFLDFDNKRTYFQASMKRLRHASLRSQGGGGGSSSVRLPVRRDRVFEDSYYALRMRSGHELRRKLHISFTGEEGIDAGGVTREWYTILAREIFNPNYALFTSAADSPTFQPNPLSFVNKDHLSYFEFVGKVIGKAIADGQLLDAHFTRSFYKHMLQLPLSYSDMEAIDPEYYRNLHSILDNPIDALGLDLTFSIEHSNFGKLDVVDLVPHGRDVAVTDDNKLEYVKLVTHHRMATGIRSQIDSFLGGLHQLVSPQLISIFNENELELLISGMPEIDIDDLKANTDYANYKPTDNVIRWFWNAMYSFTHEERALFIQFVTGTSKVPLEGFKALEGMRGTQKFNIHKAFGSSASLPTAHTCFNQLDLPEYENEDQLKTRLVLAIREGSEGFGFG